MSEVFEEQLSQLIHRAREVAGQEARLIHELDRHLRGEDEALIHTFEDVMYTHAQRRARLYTLMDNLAYRIGRLPTPEDIEQLGPPPVPLAHSNEEALTEEIDKLRRFLSDTAARQEAQHQTRQEGGHHHFDQPPPLPTLVRSAATAVKTVASNGVTAATNGVRAAMAKVG